jgi:hypothetical protein
MKLSEQISKRFEELAAEGNTVRIRNEVVDSEQFQRWASSAMHLVGSVFGENSPHYRNGLNRN